MTRKVSKTSTEARSSYIQEESKLNQSADVIVFDEGLKTP